jgi:hypothetical protein
VKSAKTGGGLNHPITITPGTRRVLGTRKNKNKTKCIRSKSLVSGCFFFGAATRRQRHVTFVFHHLFPRRPLALLAIGHVVRSAPCSAFRISFRNYQNHKQSKSKELLFFCRKCTSLPSFFFTFFFYGAPFEGRHSPFAGAHQVWHDRGPRACRVCAE